MNEVQITAPPQMMAVLSDDLPVARSRERIEVPPMKPIEEEGE